MARILKTWGGGASDIRPEAVIAAQHTALVNEIAALTAMVNSLKAKFNAHTHVENTAGAYAQNASVNAVVVGQQVTLADVAQTSTALTYD